MMQALRLVPSAALAGAMTFALVYVMQYLIATGQVAVIDVEQPDVLEFVRIKQEEIVQLVQREPQRLPEPEAPPPAPRAQLDPAQVSVALTHTAASLGTARVSGAGNLSFGAADGEYLPIVKVAPVYPRRPLQRGLEGYVIVEFTVTRQGTVRDVVVLESTSSLFDRAAVEAAQKFKYKPRVVGGEPIEVAGVRNQITFKLEH